MARERIINKTNPFWFCGGIGFPKKFLPRSKHSLSSLLLQSIPTVFKTAKPYAIRTLEILAAAANTSYGRRFFITAYVSRKRRNVVVASCQRRTRTHAYYTQTHVYTYTFKLVNYISRTRVIRHNALFSAI